MTDYVVGFLHDGKNVVLVRKNKPEWQAGKLNGVGGKIEENETPLEAMRREFYEEAGLNIHNWREFLTIHSGPHKIVFFTCKHHAAVVRRAKTMEDEKIIIHRAKSIRRRNTIPNLEWILPLAMHKRNQYYSMLAVEV